MTDYTGQQLGNYRLLRSLGRGGFAEVYLGEHIYLGTLAAIKILPDLMENNALDDFRREARIIAHLRHPHIVRVLDFGAERNMPFLVMDYVPNGTLRQRCPKGTYLPLPTVVSYTKQVAGALQYAHDRKIIHRDVKPENMLLDINDQVLLSDFGISAIERSTSRLTTLKQDSSSRSGTPIYMAPEQINGDPHPASDQYALAVVVYEWLCGVRPFAGEPLAVMFQHVHTQPPPLREKLGSISPAVEQVVLRALAKEPVRRYAAILDFANALGDAAQAEYGVTFRIPAPAAPNPRPVAAAAPVQQGASLHEAPTILARPHSPPATKSAKPEQRSKGSAPTWAVLLIALAIIVVAGGLAFYFSSSPKRGDATLAPDTHATATAGTQAHATATASFKADATATVTAAINAYNAAAAKGMMLGYNAPHTRVDPSEVIITLATVSHLKQVWALQTGGTIFSSATVVNGIAYISSNGGNFYAIDAVKGTVLWKQPIGSNDFGNAPTVANGIVYMGAPDFNLYAFNARTGKLEWKSPTGNRIGSSPTLVNGVIYIGSDDGSLYAFNALNGTQMWSRPLSPGHPIRSSPAVAAGIVYVGSDDGNLYAYTTSGQFAWKFQTGGNVRSSPAIANNVVYVGSADHMLYAINASSGAKLWSQPTNGKVGSSPAVFNNAVYVGSNDGNLYVFDAASGKLLWTASLNGSTDSSPVIANGILFIGSNDHRLYAFNAAGCGSASCSPLWSFSTGNNVVSSPVVANGYVYVGSNDGNVYALGLSGT